MNELTILSPEQGALTNANKAELQQTANEVILSVKDGHMDELEALIYARKGKEVFDLIEKGVRPIAESKVTISKGETYMKHNVAVVQGDTGVTYSFTECNDPQWVRLKAEADEATAALKDREKTLKTITKPTDMLDPETGEVTLVMPPVRRAKLGLKLTLK